MKKPVVVALFALAACGPQQRDKPIGDDVIGDDDSGVDAPGTQCVPSPEVCNDGIDNDCDTTTDCGDRDCSGVGNCPVCGNVDNPETVPLPLPDGVSGGGTCNSDADCAGTPATPNCIITGSPTVVKECHASYDSTLDFIGFPDGLTLTDTSKLLKVCVTIEHSWLRDLHFELLAPPDAGGVRKKIALQKWVDRTTLTARFLGMADDTDDDATPVPGTGLEYCWTAAATVGMLNGPTTPYTGPNLFSTPMLNAGDYKSDTPLTELQGVPLNGEWTMRVTDLWNIDNGFLFGWRIQFDSGLVEDCNGPIIQ